jgi:hypothetical protein
MYSFISYLNKLLLTISSIIFFNVLITLSSILAILLEFFSSFVYSYSKIK